MRVMTFATALFLTLIGFLVAWQFVNPAPPRTVVIATGQQDGAYFLFAERYRELLAADGIELQIRQTAGSIENIRLLEDESSAVDLAVRLRDDDDSVPCNHDRHRFTGVREPLVELRLDRTSLLPSDLGLLQ